MRISELSHISGASIPTIKYYLRERLLPPGTPTARNQATYGEEHVRRLRLIRVLAEIGGLGIGRIRDVLDAISDTTKPIDDLLGVAHHALGPPLASDDEPDLRRARSDTDAWIAAQGWRVSRDAPARQSLANALVALRRLGRDVGPEVFAPYLRHADEIATRELETIPAAGTRAEAVEAVVVGTVVFEHALMALRRLAQEHHSAVRFGAGTPD